MLQGYSSPKPFDMSEIDRCVEYDINVVDEWVSFLHRYTQNQDALKGKTVLELGPGSDLGAGLYLLSKGCYQYNACDVNSLVTSSPNEFYQKLFDRLKTIDSQTDTHFLQAQLDAVKAGKSSRLNYVVRDDFDIVAAFGKETVDIVFSQAAFEHFDDIDATVAQLSAVCKADATLVIEVDLKTHSRWITAKDPNNIYRYSDTIYNLFKFRGIPNRMRPYQYIDALKRCGWKDIELHGISQQSESHDSYSGMNQRFQDSKNQMEYLSIIICARRVP
ncbi:MAG: methyltransferase domain-containing protein [Cyanobacteria bacterium J06632_3]